MVSLMWLARAKFILFRNFGVKHFNLYTNSFSQDFYWIFQSTNNGQLCAQITLALWRDVVFLESFYVEFDISREIILILEKTYSGQGFVTNYAVLVAKIDLFWQNKIEVIHFCNFC